MRLVPSVSRHCSVIERAISLNSKKWWLLWPRAQLIIVAVRVHTLLTLGVSQVPSRCLQVWIVIRIRTNYFMSYHLT